MSKHAPGPWSLKMYMSFGGTRQVIDHLADASGRPVRFVGVTLSSGDECEANTRLASAAPSFLEWAIRQQSRKHRGLISLDYEDVIELEALIAKASPSVASVIVGEEK